MSDREDDGGGFARGGKPGILMDECFGVDDPMSSRPESELGAKRLFSEVSGSDTETGGGVVRGLDMVGKRGRGGGLARARKYLRQREEEESESAFDSCLEKSLRKERVGGKKAKGKEKEVPLDLGSMGAEAMMIEAEKSLDLIKGLVGKSTNLKGGYSSKIMKASAFVRDVLDVLVARTEAEETRRLRADIGRLQRENAGLKEEVRAHRQQFEEMRRERVAAVQAATDGQSSRDKFQEMEANIARLVGNLVDGRLAALESQLKREEVIRPPLTGDNSAVAVAARVAIRRAAVQREAGKTASSLAPSAPVISEADFPSLPAPSKGKANRAKGGKEVVWTSFGPSTSSGRADPVAEGNGAKAGWTEVVRRKAPKKKEVVPVPKTSAPQQKKKAGPKEGPKKVTLPRSQAVMLKLRPEAAAKGASYLSVLLRAEKEVDTKELGIGPLRIRSTATGARIIEVPGSTSADKADALAAKLRSALAEEVVVSRPVKFTDVRVTGLNDATTADRLIAAVAREGGCTEAQVRVRSVRPGLRGTGSALLEVPAMAAKKLLQLGGLLAITGTVQTCVRRSGGSVVDVSFATPTIARRVEGWRVEAGVETLGQRPGGSEREAVREEARDAVVQHWTEDLTTATFGRRTLDAIGPVLKDWLERSHGSLSFRLVQVLSGHGCFGSYLHRIGREESPSCHQCGAAVDTAEHTLEVCPSWAEPRRALVAAVGNDLSLPGVIIAMLGSEEAWAAVASFCEDVMSQKEAAEREREDDPLAPALRRRRRGGRRRTQRPPSPASGGVRRAASAGALPPASQRTPLAMARYGRALRPQQSPPPPGGA
nr:uncharacterized protein LOC116776090 [Danaus plexippus plexippus]